MCGNARGSPQDPQVHSYFWEFGVLGCFATLEQGLGDQNLVQIGPFLGL